MKPTIGTPPLNGPSNRKGIAAMMTAFSHVYEKHCVFRSAYDWLGWPATEVREITLPPALVPVPWSDAALVGLCHLRSEFLPVFSLRALSDVPACEPDLERQMLVLKTTEDAWGLLVDRVVGLESLETSPSTAGRGDDWNSATLGWANHQGHVVRVLDPEAFVRFVKQRLEGVWNCGLPAARPKRVSADCSAVSQGTGL